MLQKEPETIHAYWKEHINSGFSDHQYVCSKCGEYALYNQANKQELSNYCPACHAKMDGRKS